MSNNTFEPKVTQKGTKLPILNLKGKPYLQVAHRLVWFREEHILGRIVTSLVAVTDKEAVAKAEIYATAENKEGMPFDVLLSTAHKKESLENFGDYIEKAETGAIGRALAMAGFGTQFDPEFDEGDRLADSPISIAVRNNNVKPPADNKSELPKLESKTNSNSKPNKVARISGKSEAPVSTAPVSKRETINKLISQTSKVAIDQKKLTQEKAQALLIAYGVTKKEELTDEDANSLLNDLRKVIA